MLSQPHIDELAGTQDPQLREDRVVKAFYNFDQKYGTFTAAINKMIHTTCANLKPIHTVELFPQLDDGSKPDLAGYDVNGGLLVLLEAKVDTKFHNEQPERYLLHLPGDTPAALVCLAPPAKIPALWKQARRITESRGPVQIYHDEPHLLAARFLHPHRCMVAFSYIELLDNMKQLISHTPENPNQQYEDLQTLRRDVRKELEGANPQFWW